MSPQPPTADASSTKGHESKGTTPPDGISGQYRIQNPQDSKCLHETMYVLSYEGSAWPESENYDGILGLYTSLDNAKRAGQRWLIEQGSFHSVPGEKTETRFLDWEGSGKSGVWDKAKGELGPRWLESRRVRVKKCEVRTDSSLSKKDKDEGGKANDGGEDGGEEDDDGVKEKGKGDGGVVEGMERLAV